LGDLCGTALRLVLLVPLAVVLRLFLTGQGAEPGAEVLSGKNPRALKLIDLVVKNPCGRFCVSLLN
jgi:hypothetical protein